ncbi:MAG: hypothetical protein V9F00_06515 [Nocardioides sp.]
MVRRQAGGQDAQALRAFGPTGDWDDLVQWSRAHAEPEGGDVEAAAAEFACALLRLVVRSSGHA